MSLHPDLSALHNRYLELYESASQGHISPDDALATLNALAVTDGTGAVWQIDAYGKYQRAAFAGDTPTEADPSQYVGPETVVSNPHTGEYDLGQHEPVADPWGAAGDTPPGVVGFGATESDPFNTAPNFPHTQATSNEPDHDDPFSSPPATGTIHRPIQEPPARSLAKTEKKNSAPKFDIVKTVWDNKVIVIIAVLAAVLIGAKLLGGDQNTDANIPTADPAVENPAPSNPALADPDNDDEFNTDPAVVDLPNAGDLSRVLDALTDGDRKFIAKNVAGNADAALVAEAAAFYAGLEKTDLNLTHTAVAEGAEPGTASQVWNVKDGKKNLITIHVSWVKDGDTWNLQTVPVP